MANPQSRPRPQTARLEKWVGPLASLLLLAVFHLGAAADPPDPAEVLEPVQVLGCLVDRELPSPAASAEDGGFSFSYQSLGGLAEDGRSCTVYRLRNTAGRPPTPVRWLAGGEVLVDFARLARCATDEECAWLEIARYFDGDVIGSDTRLSFGLNADSFSVEDDGLVARTAPDVGATNASVGTEVVGRLTLSDGTDVELDLIVKSRFERRQGVIALIYELTASDEALLNGEQIALVWRRRGGDGPNGAPHGGVRTPRDFAPFLSLPGQPSLGVGQAFEVSRSSGGVSLVRLVDELSFEPGLLLDFVEADQPDTVLLSVPLPAFLPQNP